MSKSSFCSVSHRDHEPLIAPAVALLNSHMCDFDTAEVSGSFFWNTLSSFADAHSIKKEKRLQNRPPPSLLRCNDGTNSTSSMAGRINDRELEMSNKTPALQARVSKQTQTWPPTSVIARIKSLWWSRKTTKRQKLRVRSYRLLSLYISPWRIA